MDIKLQRIAVLGASGKMGRGISLLLLQQVAKSKGSILILLDKNEASFVDLKIYLRFQLIKYAERGINELRFYYRGREDLIDNEDVIREFVENAFDRVRLVTSLEECTQANMVFEAIVEDLEIKSAVFSDINKIASPNAVYFSNTSSIPIHILEKRGGIEGRLVGFHFYNPPVIQKLLELIVPENIQPQVKDLAVAMAGLLNKTVVFSKDIAGFIGNGHFIQEMVEACTVVEELRKTVSYLEAVSAVNYVTQEFLLRPMGIFQLIDYVGLNVCCHIAKVMNEYLDESFDIGLVQALLEKGFKGGQQLDGFQKRGFFLYENGKPIKIYDVESDEEGDYLVPEEIKCLPLGHESWKTLSKDKNKKKKIRHYFEALAQEKSMGASLALHFLKSSQMIAYRLVENHVASSIEDVNTVLELGFFHLYGVDDFHQ